MAGSDLMSAPKVTVLSGKRASITVAQELRYPESYGDIESTASSSGGGGQGGGGNAAISITAGTPQDFVTRNVGVEMSVTPNVENDDTISLILEPRVTEFEGFVEYGGPVSPLPVMQMRQCQQVFINQSFQPVKWLQKSLYSMARL